MLDDLLCEDLALSYLRRLFHDDGRFVLAITAMLQCGEVRLLEKDGTKVNAWRWDEALSNYGEYRASITEQGMQRMG